jgi:hypothetical protein
MLHSDPQKSGIEALEGASREAAVATGRSRRPGVRWSALLMRVVLTAIACGIGFELVAPL